MPFKRHQHPTVEQHRDQTPSHDGNESRAVHQTKIDSQTEQCAGNQTEQDMQQYTKIMCFTMRYLFAEKSRIIQISHEIPRPEERREVRQEQHDDPRYRPCCCAEQNHIHGWRMSSVLPSIEMTGSVSISALRLYVSTI